MNGKYKLVKPLPRAKVGDGFHLSNKGNLVHDDSGVAFYTKGELKKYPTILKEWFEQDRATVYDLKEGDDC